jgi:hypothetical protein
MRRTPARRFVILSIAAIWACFLIRAFFYCATIPLWEGFDEYAHFDYIRYLALERRLPRRDTRISGDVAASLQLAPLAWTLKDYFTAFPHVTHDAYWRLPEGERAMRQRALAAIGNGQAAGQENDALLLYEAQHPPLYYAIMAVPYYLARHRPLLERVWLLRILSVLLASLVVPGTYILGRTIFGEPAYGVGAATVVAAMPGVMMTLARVSNEALAMVLGTAILAVMARPKRNPYLLGVLLGLALLTKAYFLTTVLAVLAWLSVQAWRSRSGAAARELLPVAIPAAAIAGWWYWVTWRATGTISGEEHDVAFHRLGFGTWLRTAGHVNWMQALDANFSSHIWVGGWSFVCVRGWMYHVFAMLAFLAIVGIVGTILRGKPAAPLADIGGVRMLVVVFAAFAAGLAYHAVTLFAVHGISAVNGWYIYGLAAGEAVLWPLGLMVLIPSGGRPYVFPLLCVTFLALEAFAMHIYLLPYYAGFIAHVRGNDLRALQLSQLGSGGWRVLAQRLAVNKPWWLNGRVIAGLWAGYVLASGWLVAEASRAARAIQT